MGSLGCIEWSSQDHLCRPRRETGRNHRWRPSQLGQRIVGPTDSESWLEIACGVAVGVPCMSVSVDSIQPLAGNGLFCRHTVTSSMLVTGGDSAPQRCRRETWSRGTCLPFNRYPDRGEISSPGDSQRHQATRSVANRSIVLCLQLQYSSPCHSLDWRTTVRDAGPDPITFLPCTGWTDSKGSRPINSLSMYFKFVCQGLNWKLEMTSSTLDT